MAETDRRILIIEQADGTRVIKRTPLRAEWTISITNEVLNIHPGDPGFDWGSRLKQRRVTGYSAVEVTLGEEHIIVPRCRVSYARERQRRYDVLRLSSVDGPPVRPWHPSA